MRSLAGLKFGKLIALSREVGADGRLAWNCTCDCGGTVVVRTSALTTGNTTSCGCGVREAMSATGKKNATHGKSRTPEYRSWARMLHRCYARDDINFHLYGGRGVTVSERWRNSFEAFLDDMGEKPEGKPTIDRINPDGGYDPANCRWASYAEQNKNRRPFTRRKKELSNEPYRYV